MHKKNNLIAKFVHNYEVEVVKKLKHSIVSCVKVIYKKPQGGGGKHPLKIVIGLTGLSRRM